MNLRKTKLQVSTVQIRTPIAHFSCIFTAIRYGVSKNAPCIFPNAAHSWYECDLLFRICKAHLRKSKAHFHIRREDKIFQGELSLQTSIFQAQNSLFLQIVYSIPYTISTTYHTKPPQNSRICDQIPFRTEIRDSRSPNIQFDKMIVIPA